MTVSKIGTPASVVFLLVKVGSDHRPATAEDLIDVRKDFEKVIGPAFPELPVIVTHHGVQVEVVTVREPESVRAAVQCLKEMKGLDVLI